MILDVARCYLWLLYINIRIGKNRCLMFDKPVATCVIFIAGRAKATLLFGFFGDFRCGALLFMVIYVIYKYKNR